MYANPIKANKVSDFLNFDDPFFQDYVNGDREIMSIAFLNLS